jgi:hypothetical protein
MGLAIVIISVLLGVAIAVFIIWKLGSVSAVFGVPLLMYIVLKETFAPSKKGRR